MAFKRKKIQTAQTVGGKLQAQRRKKKLTLEQAEEATKIRQKYLKAIESDNWSEFPSNIYVYGFVKKYAKFLELDEDEVVKNFKNEFGYKKNNSIINKIKKPTHTLVVTPKLLLWSSLIIVIGFIVGYIIVSTQKISQPPEIEIISPKEDVIATVRDIVIEGKTSVTAVMEINGQLVSVDDKGYFSQKTTLNEGINVFELKAKSRVGKEESKTIKVLYSSNPVVVSTTPAPS